MKKTALIILIILTAGFLSLDAQSINFKVGVFYPDTNSDLWDDNFENLAFDKSDMAAAYWAAELEMFMNRNFSLAVEAGHYRRDIFTVYKDVEYEDGSPINQDISLRITSFEAGFKFYPIGNRQVFNPYIGIGAGLYAWKYYQGGEFVDWIEEVVYEGEAYTDKVTPGVNARAGFVYRLSRSAGVSLEGKYTYIRGTLSSLFEGFQKLDLGGFTFTAGIHLFL